MNFATLQGLTIPQGVVTQIADASGKVVWSKKQDFWVPSDGYALLTTDGTWAGEIVQSGCAWTWPDSYTQDRPFFTSMSLAARAYANIYVDGARYGGVIDLDGGVKFGYYYIFYPDDSSCPVSLVSDTFNSSYASMWTVAFDDGGAHALAVEVTKILDVAFTINGGVTRTVEDDTTWATYVAGLGDGTKLSISNDFVYYYATGNVASQLYDPSGNAVKSSDIIVDGDYTAE